MVRITFMFIAAAVACSCPLFGQVVEGETQASILPYPGRYYDSVKEFLALTESQFEQLLQLQKEKSEEWMARYREISQKEREMYNLLNSGSQDASRIGKLMVEIHALRVQPPPSNALYRQRALGVLSADQKAKLSVLDQALKLNTPAYQAVSLNLIDYYYQGIAVPFAGPAMPMPAPMPDAVQGVPEVATPGR